MMKTLWLVFICFWQMNVVVAQLKQAPPSGLEKSLLWEISGNGLKSPSYLFGTISYVGKNFVDSLITIKEKFDVCKAVLTDVVIDSSYLKKIGLAIRLSNQSLEKILTPKEYEIIGKEVKLLTNLDLVRFNNIKPVYLELFILSYLYPRITNNTNNPVLVKFLQEEGKQEGKEIYGLETVEEQIEIFFNVPIERQKERLLFLITEIEATKNNVAMFKSLYGQQDVEGIYQMLMKTDREFTPEEKDQMYKERNVRWVKVIQSNIKIQPTFVAVTVLNMGGEFGLINLLRLAGFSVTPVKI